MEQKSKQTKPINLDEKLKILEEFKKTGQELIASTVYKGYPVGRWDIEIRSHLKNGIINPTPSQREKIENLGISNRKYESPMSMKIKLFIEFKKLGQELTSETIYEEQPIGIWAIEIRSQIRKGRIKPTKEELKQLKELGILDRRYDSNVEEKIQELIEWNSRYPLATMVFLEDIEGILKQYANSDEEYKTLVKRYERMQNHYAYIRSRKSRRKINIRTS